MKHLKLCHPEFRPLAKKVLVHVAHLAELAGVGWYIASSFRSPERQWELYKKGRVKKGVDWVPVQGAKRVTNAQPHQTPHCHTLSDKPATCALDVALTRGMKWLPDGSELWSLVGTAVGLVNAQEGSQLVWGGMWSSIRDYPHFELRNWRDLA